MTNNKAEIIKLEFGGLLNFAIKKSWLREMLLFQSIIEESVLVHLTSTKKSDRLDLISESSALF